MNRKALFVSLIFLTFFAAIFSLFAGATGIGFVEAEVLKSIRIPRTLAAFGAGSALGISGLIFQALFRNQLATPYTLGVSSGASFGAVLFIKLQIFLSFLFAPGVTLFSFLGAFLSTGLVYSLAHFKKNITTASMLLAGASVNLFFSSLILFIQYIADYNQTIQMIHWLMGSLDAVSSYKSFVILFFAFFILAVALFFQRDLNLFSVSEEIAISRGTNTKKVRKILFFAVSLAVGGIVSFTGPIGFVGLMIPHITRLLTGANHKNLIPAVFLAGGVFLTLCDTASRILIAPAEIPVGVITALLGAPFFIWLLIREKN